MSHFNAAANEWDNEERVELMGTLAKKTLEVLSLEKKTDILDFGCGTGLFGLELFDYASSLVGIDTSPGMLDVFNQKTKDYDHISSFEGNLEDFKTDKKFGLIVSSMVFHHLDSPSGILGTLKTFLKPDGKMAIVDLVEEDGTFHSDNEKMGVKHFGFSEEEIAEWATENDLHYSLTEINEISRNDRVYKQFLAVFEF